MSRKQHKTRRRKSALHRADALGNKKATIRAHGASVDSFGSVWKQSSVSELVAILKWYIPRYRNQRHLASLRPRSTSQLPSLIVTARGTLDVVIRWTVAVGYTYLSEIRRHNNIINTQNVRVLNFEPFLELALKEVQFDMWSFSTVTQILFATARVHGLDAQRRWLKNSAYVSTPSVSNAIYYSKAIACEGDRHPEDVLDILNRFLFNSLDDEDVALFMYVMIFQPQLHHTLYIRLASSHAYFPAIDQYEALANTITSDPQAWLSPTVLPYIDEVLNLMIEVGDWRAAPLRHIQREIALDYLYLPLLDSATTNFLESLGIADTKETAADRSFEILLTNEFMFQPQSPRGYLASSLYGVKIAQSAVDVRMAIFRRTLASRHFEPADTEPIAPRIKVHLTFDDLRAAIELSNSAFEKRELFRAACLKGIEEGKIQDVLVLLYDFTTLDPHGITYFPTSILLQHLDDDDVASIGTDPKVAVALSRTVPQSGEEGENLVYIAVEAYLSHRLVSKPSDLSIDNPVIVDFLYEACSTSSLRQSLEFLSKDAMEEERIIILFGLEEANSVDAALYVAEIHEIIEQQTIDELLQRFHIGKVQCDEASLSKWAVLDLAPRFNRLRDFINAGLLPVERNSDEEFLAHLTSGSLETFTFKVPSNESLEIARTILSELVQKFALDPRYGVDSYLSLAMRHGAVAAHLRSPLSAENILTARGLEGYSEDCFWSNYYRENGYEDIANALGTVLAKFSEAFDEKLEEIKDDLLHVRRPEKPRGLVDVDWNEASVLSLSSRFAEVPDLETFISEFNVVFWANLESKLVDARKYINTIMAKELGDLLDRLEAEVSEYTGQVRLSPFSDAVMRARQELSNAVTDVASWHNVARSTDVEPLRLVDIILAAHKIVKRLYPDFEPKIHFSGDTTISLTYSLHILIEVFKALFTNVYEHSGTMCPALSVHVTVISQDALGVEFTSECLDMEKAEVAASENNEKIRTGEYEKKLPKEGGSGLAKVARATIRDGKPHTIVSVDREKSTFSVGMIFNIVNI